MRSADECVRRWVPKTPRDSAAGERSAEMIVAWVNANGCEARYDPCTGPDCHPSTCGPRIAIRTADGWAYAQPGDTIVMDAPGEFRVAPTDEDISADSRLSVAATAPTTGDRKAQR